MADSNRLAVLEPVELAVAWNLRGDPAHPEFGAEAERALGLALPRRPNASARVADDAMRAAVLPMVLLWLGPTSWLYVGSDAQRTDFDATRKALNRAGGALFDVSASYVAWSVGGAGAARALNRGCPLDFHPNAFPAGHCAQSMLGHVNALFFRPDEAPGFVVMVARSFAADAARDLQAFASSPP